MHQRQAKVKEKNTGLFHEALANTERSHWEWTVLHVVMDDEDRAYELEKEEIAKLRPELNMRAGGKGGGKWLGDTSRFATQTGKTPSEETRKKLSDFQKNRKRTRTHNRDEMFRLYENGDTMSSIAKQLNCDYALVWRVIKGKYKK